ncbi:hypothetical protein [Mycobacterium sp. IS-3022]|uniref:hypothetical protein n=1 Tax=Mycobacterium sp. IS-3022 TaxID=1772277 RepID=UPI0007415ACB|nr:hypothetical protein [Mycobacterium sp. IS-3022]KUI04450.1 hypothetical protein AU188_03920 [Mycobacterium sp. IS-3022]
MTAPANLSSKDVAEALGITAKELRVFLRAAGEGLSSRDGKSYVFTKANVAAIKKAYPKWLADRTAARAAKAEAKAAAEKADEPVADAS